MINPSALVELAARCEAAEASEQRAMLEAAYRAVFPSLRSAEHSREECEASDLRAYRFWRMLDAEAYESAALTLVPEGWGIKLVTAAKGHLEPFGITTPDLAMVFLHSLPMKADGKSHAPALALCAAALRARSTQGTNLQDTPASHGEPRG